MALVQATPVPVVAVSTAVPANGPTFLLLAHGNGPAQMDHVSARSRPMPEPTAKFATPIATVQPAPARLVARPVARVRLEIERRPIPAQLVSCPALPCPEPWQIKATT